MITKNVQKIIANDYLKRASECKNAMRWCFENRHWNACVINAIHSAISAADALCVFEIGVRHAGERHDEAVQLLISINPGENAIINASKHLRNLLGIKSGAEYGERLMTEKDASAAVKDTERLLGFVEGRIKR